tara:strand:+ start:676 stop:1296 length:621 start_codon:yes stop_codon:yes gene_type:complete
MNSDVPANLWTRTRAIHKRWWKAWLKVTKAMGVKPHELEMVTIDEELRAQFEIDLVDEELAQICQEVADAASATDADPQPAYSLQLLMGWITASPDMASTETLKEAKEKADDLLTLAKLVAGVDSATIAPLRPLSNAEERALACLERANGKDVHVEDIRRAMGVAPSPKRGSNDAQAQYRACDELANRGLAEKGKRGYWRWIEPST